jgi:tRNA(Ile)-lysidine synthase
MEFLSRIAETIKKFGLLSPGQNVVAGVSGGADSLCLLACLNQLGYRVTIAHLDHQLREESEKEAQFVEEVGKQLELETVIEKGDVRALADRGYSIEEAARLVRYRFLARVANARGVDTISTGHTADDQIETVLMHFLRGAGPSGLRGILPVTSLSEWVDIPEGYGIRLVRPLLEIGHSQTEAYCRKVKLNPIQDPSNKDPSFFRNRIRHHLIPILREYNPGIENIILRMARVMEAEAQMVGDLLQEQWNEIVISDDETGTKLNRKAFVSLPVALQRSLIRRIIKNLRPGIRDVGFEHVERAKDFLLSSKNYNTLQLLAGLEVLTISPNIAYFRDEGQKLYFPEYPQMQSQKTFELSVPTCVALENSWTLTVDHKDLGDINHLDFLASLDDYQAAVDVNKIRGKIRLRTLEPGDRISPLGMSGSLKVSDLFINNKIPQPARRFWPLIVDDEKVIWVVELRIADECRITSSTKQILHFRVIPGASHLILNTPLEKG